MRKIGKTNMRWWCILMTMVFCLVARSHGSVYFTDNFNNTQLDTYYGSAGDYGLNQELAVRQGGSAAPLQWRQVSGANPGQGQVRVNEAAYPSQLTIDELGETSNPAAAVTCLSGLSEFTLDIDFATLTSSGQNWISIHVLADLQDNLDGALSTNNGLMLLIRPAFSDWFLYYDTTTQLASGSGTSWQSGDHLTITVNENPSRISAWVNNSQALFTDLAIPLGGNDGDDVVLSQYGGQLVGFDNLVVTAHSFEAEKTDVLLFFGLYTQHYHLIEALNEIGVTGIELSNSPYTGCEFFPSIQEDLNKYRLLILSDINKGAIPNWSMISNYVSQGGHLLILGGPYAYGKGKFVSTDYFSQFIAADLEGPFDLKWCGKGNSWPLVAASPGHSLLQGLIFDENPLAYWVHDTTPRTGTEVVLSAGSYPAVMVSSYGQGKVIMVTLTPLGKPQQDENPFWETVLWKQLVQNIWNYTLVN